MIYYRSGFLETGVERIVDQVVNPKINTVFLPQVEEVAYKYLGLEKPNRNTHYKPSNGPLSINTVDLLPTDLDPISPDTDLLDKEKHASKIEVEMLAEESDSKLDDSKTEDDESPPFEAITEQSTFPPPEETSNDSRISGISGLTSHDSNDSAAEKLNKFNILVPDTNNPDSQLSKVSSNSRLSIITTDSKHTPEKMDISDDTQGSQCSKIEENSNNSDVKPVIEENIAVDFKDELEQIRMEINGHNNKTESEEKLEIKTENVKTEIEDKSDLVFLFSSSGDNKEIVAPMKTEEKVIMDNIKTEEIHTSEIDKNEAKFVIEPVKIEGKENEQSVKMEEKQTTETVKIESEVSTEVVKIEEKENVEVVKIEEKPVEAKCDSAKKSDRSRHDSDRKRDSTKYSDKDRKDDKDKKSSDKDRKDKDKDKYKSSSSSSKDKYRDRSKDNKSKDVSRSKDDKSSDKLKEKEKSKDDKNKSSSSSSKYSSRDRNSKSESKSSSRDHSTSRSSRDNRDKCRDEKTKSDSKKDSDEIKSKADSKKDDDLKSRKSDHKSSSSSSNKSKESRSSDSLKKSSRDHKSSSSTSKDYRDKKDPKKSSKREKDDHSSSKEKKDPRRSADRDSNDGSSGTGNSSANSGKEKEATSSSSNKSKSDNSETSGSNSGDSGQSDNSQPIIDTGSNKVLLVELSRLEVSINPPVVPPNCLQQTPSCPTANTQPDTTIIKLKKPKFASNIFEARKLMKIRRKMEKMEKKRQLQRELAAASQTIAVLENDSLEETDSKDSESILLIATDTSESSSDSKNTAVVSKESWDAIEQKLSESAYKGVDFNSYADDSSSSTQDDGTNKVKSTSKTSSEDEDVLYFSNNVSPSTERFLHSVEVFQQNTLNFNTKAKRPLKENVEKPIKRSRKQNLNNLNHIVEKDEEINRKAPVKKVKGRKRKLEERIDTENNNKKIQELLMLDDSDEIDRRAGASPSTISNGSIENITKPKARRGRKSQAGTFELSFCF